MVSLRSISLHYLWPHLSVQILKQPHEIIPKSCLILCLLVYILEDPFILHCGLYPKPGSPPCHCNASLNGPHWVWGGLPYAPPLSASDLSALLGCGVLMRRDHQSVFCLHSTGHSVWHIVGAQEMLVDWGTNE